MKNETRSNCSAKTGTSLELSLSWMLLSESALAFLFPLQVKMLIDAPTLFSVFL